MSELDTVSPSTGPTTAKGKASSSKNATRHGLTGFALIVPGESVAAYRRCQNDWLAAMAPASGAEAQIVAQLADAAWRLDRCMRLEHQQQLQAVEAKMKKTDDFAMFTELNTALKMLNALAGATDDLLARDPLPGSRGSLHHFLAGAEGVAAAVRQAEVFPEAMVDHLDAAVDRVAHEAEAGQVFAPAVTALSEIVVALQKAAAPRLERAEKTLAALRLQLAQAAIPEDDKEQKRLSRYRAEIEKSQARLLGILKEIKATVAEARGTAHDPVRLRLRVIK